ncbi:glycosyltransferase family 4 protein [Rubinisphaera margarita]|uniref:glycosyltransferase family 4 protein n=1 Tax=Rubinisphaera margarita TaxID=2909586 RepID=UPI001EE90D6C|nr:glycosyltransferase family 4 protein [Rubinisphaera margarita]MCG6158197.1 glycosyltransferase family 4 protein [Rubinisphaera margarita]
MKIGLVAHLKYPISKPYAGGLESFTAKFVEQLQARGHDVTLFASGDSDRGLNVSPITPTATKLLQRSSDDDRDNRVEHLEDLAYDRLFDRLRNSDFDLVHNHSIHPTPLRRASELACPMVTTIHVPVLPRLAEQLFDKPARECGSFVNISEVNRKEWEPLIGDHAVIPNGVDTSFWKQCARPRNGRAVWFGRILADKGTHWAIDAAHEAGVPIDLAGPIADDDYFRQMVLPRLRSADRYLGHASHEELCRIIGAAEVCVVTPCWDEPFGLVVAEALACGTPVAAFARGAISELVTSDVGQLARPNDVRSLARAIRLCRLIDSSQCRHIAQKRFSLTAMMDRYEDYYRQLLSGTFASDNRLIETSLELAR